MHVARGGVSHRQSLLRHAQPKTEIPIDYHQRPAGSFLGDFRTPRGARNSSRKRNGSFVEHDGDMPTHIAATTDGLTNCVSN
jgi:hypothetical protein